MPRGHCCVLLQHSSPLQRLRFPRHCHSKALRLVGRVQKLLAHEMLDTLANRAMHAPQAYRIMLTVAQLARVHSRISYTTESHLHRI